MFQLRSVPVTKSACYLVRSSRNLINEDGIAYALVSLGKNYEGIKEIPKEVSSLLSKFKGLAPEELPAGLPPLCDLHHQIDFIPGAILPSSPQYRLPPNEYDELQRQVEDLVKRYLIRESLSPCDVPTLLNPKKDGTWRMFIDSRSINETTVKYRFPIPQLDNILDELDGAKHFSKIDLRSGYDVININKKYRKYMDDFLR